MGGKVVSAVLVLSAAALLAGCGADIGEKMSESTEEQIVIKMFTNLPNRKNGQGLVEQMLIDEYMEENENVVIEVEALDDEAYKTKFRAYCMEGMPDVVNIWGQPSFLDEVLEAGILAELDEADYSDYKFVEGSLEGFKKDGKLYGLPRGTAMHLFTSGQAAMLYTGSWESAMALNEDIAEDIRTNIRVFSMPVVEGGEGKATDIAAWNRGGYAVSARSAVKEEAVRFLNFMYQPDKLSRYGWETGNGMSAQDQSAYMSGHETELQKQFVDMLKQATSLSGTPMNDCGPSEFKESIESTIADVSNETMEIDEFLQTIGNACKRE